MDVALEGLGFSDGSVDEVGGPCSPVVRDRRAIEEGQRGLLLVAEDFFHTHTAHEGLQSIV